MQMTLKAGGDVANVFRRLMLGVSALVVATSVLAITQAPHELVIDVIDRVMSKVGSAYAKGGVTSEDVLGVFEEEISPHLDFEMITRWLAGEQWETYGETERAELTWIVRQHIIRVYAALLARGPHVDLAVDPSSRIRTRSAKVSAVLATAQGQTFDIEFRLLRTDDTWKLCDLAVGGLSFARSLRAELSPALAADGLEGLKTYLEKHGH